MKRVSPDAVSYCKNMTFTFSKTLRNQDVNLNDYQSSNFIIDVDGGVYQGASANEQSATITVIGGINGFINEKAVRLQLDFYVTSQQKITIYRIIKGLSQITDNATISSDNPILEQSVTALYKNYCG